MSGHLQKPNIFVLVLFFSFANVIGVMLSAALPSIEMFFHVNKDTSQNVISIYLLGCFLGQFLYAPMMNAIGKKKSLIIGISLAILGSILCLSSITITSFNLLLMGRFFTALGTCCGPVLTIAIVTDYFSHNESKKIFSLLMSGFSIIPAIGVYFGGVVTTYISWQACFYLMLGYCSIVLWLSKFIHEIVQDHDFSHFHPFRIARGFYREFSSIPFTTFMLISSCASCSMFVFATEAPFIAKKFLQMSASLYGLCNLIPNFALFIGGVFSAYIGHKISSDKTLGICSSLFIAVALVIGLLFGFEIFSLFTVFIIPATLFILTPFIVSSGRSIANMFSVDKSYAASCLYILTYLSMFLTISSFHLFSDTTTLAMPIIYLGLGGIMLVFWLVGRVFVSKDRKPS